MDFCELIGMTFKSIKVINNTAIEFEAINGDKFELYHEDECCESVTIEDINGDLEDLINTPIIKAEETFNTKNPEPKNKLWENIEYESFTWTFYKLATIKGYVTIRFLGMSNGCYSEKAELIKM